MKKLQFGFIGAGQIAYSSATSVNAHPNARVVAAQDLNTERLNTFGSEYGIERRYTEASDVFNDSEVDAVYIAVPNKFHAPLAIEALKAGKHVILEKPFAMSAQEGEAVIAAAEVSGKKFTLGMNQRFRSDSQTVRELVRTGVLGDVYHGKAFWYRRSGIPKLGTWFGKKELAGGGALYDIGVHLLDLCLFTMGNFEPVTVSGMTYTKFGNRGIGEGSWGKSDAEHTDFDVDDFASGFIRFANGASVTLDVSWACHAEEGDRNDVQLYGTEGGARCYPAKLFSSPMTKDAEYQVTEDPKIDLPYSTDRFHNFINHIEGKEELCVLPSQALAVQRILDAIDLSCKTGKEVSLVS